MLKRLRTLQIDKRRAMLTFKRKVLECKYSVHLR